LQCNGLLSIDYRAFAGRLAWLADNEFITVYTTVAGLHCTEINNIMYAEMQRKLSIASELLLGMSIASLCAAKRAASFAI